MQLFVLIMMMALLAHDNVGIAAEPALSGWRMLAAALVPYAMLVLVMWAACRRALYLMTVRPARLGRTLRRLDMTLAAGRAATLALLLADLYLLGWLSWLRATLGHWLLINDLLAIAPALATVALGWWAFYPVDRRIREVTLLRELDDGGALWPIGSRGQFVWSQVRHQLLLVLLPMLALLGWTQAVERWFNHGPTAAYAPALTFAGGLSVFLFAPLMIRSVWDTTALPAGPLRDRLLALCDDYRVRVRQLLLWRTYGGLINGAVMGLIGPLRFILLTDGLVERMDDEHIEAVMAHELGHVKRRHMPWMAVCAIGTLGGLAVLIDTLTQGVNTLAGGAVRADSPVLTATIDGIALAVLVAGWALLFGYISRRFERQADTFAAQHMSRKLADPGDGRERITPEAAHTVAQALRRVAELNHHPIRRQSWRHGSIQWRIDYLLALADTPLDRCPIDRQVRRIRWGCLFLLAAVAALDLLANL